jgi:two-component system nitrate/nitrite response regulator NarL
MARRKQCVTLASVEKPPSGDPCLNRVRLFVLSDIRLLREGLVLALSQQPSVLVIGASDLSVSPTQVAELRPDVLLLDATKLDNLDLSLSLRQVLPSAKIVALAVAEIDDYIIACAEAGISGYIPCTGSIEEVVSAVHGAVCGELHCTPRTSAILFKYLALPSARRGRIPVHEALTQRETEIVVLVEQGLSNKEIARSLRIGYATVKNHVHNILSKLQVRRRGEAAAQIRRAKTGTPRRPGFLCGLAGTATIVDQSWVGTVCSEGLDRIVAALA